MRRVVLLLCLSTLGSACAARTQHGTTPASPVAPVVSFEPLHFSASRSEDGFRVQAYDAQLLFQQGLDLMRQGDCDAANEAFDGLSLVFPQSRYLSASLYNAGLCLQRQSRWAEAAERYETLLRVCPDSRDVKHALFQLAFLYLETGRWEEALGVAEALLGRDDLDSDERVEAMARRAAAFLGQAKVDAAAVAAQAALRFYRTRSEQARVKDPHFAASASFTLAETLRLRSEAIRIPLAAVDQQHEILESRAQLLLAAQRSYFDTIRLTDAYWASAAGYRIGAMYDAFWREIMSAPVPLPKRPMSAEERDLYKEAYRTRLAELVSPLTRHAIRYWELTLDMVDRTGVDSEWTERIREEMAEVRSRLLPRADAPSPPGGQERAPQAKSTAPPM